VDVNGLFTIFDLSGDLTFNAGKEIKFLATADVVIPAQVPFIGGDTIAGVGFYFDHIFTPDNPSTTVAAWISLHIIWDVEVGFEYVYDKANPKGSFSLIGARTINQFKAGVVPPDQNHPHTYTYTADLAGLVPANATSATLSADWSKVAAGVTIVGQPKFRVQRTLNGQTQTITEDQFAANGIQIIDDPHFSSPTSKAIQIVGSTTDPYAPITGDYKLLVDVTTQDGQNPFPDYPNPGAADVLKIQATSHIPKPTFGPRGAKAPYVPVVPQTPGGTFPVTLQGTIDESFLTSGKEVSLYRVLVQDPQQRAVLIGTSQLTQVSGNGVNWQATVNVPVEGLYPLPYTVYAVVNDGFNVPVKTANSAPFTPAFAVIGSVSNQAHDAETGWSVFLDYNGDGIREPNEPIYQTSNPDGFFAFTPTFDPRTGWDPVPVNKPFNVVLIVPAPNNFDPVAPQTIQYDGQNTKAVPFVVNEKSAIKGTVFQDVQGNGNKNDGTPIAGATVYLDVNHSGHLDPGDPTTLTDAAGNYDFANQAPGTYTVALDVLSLDGPGVAAYDVPDGTVGKFLPETSLFNYGMDFDVNRPIVITSLGLFDSGQSGWDVKGGGPFFYDYAVELFDRRTQSSLGSVQFTPDDPGTLIGGSRFKPLAKPLVLPAGFQGTIAANIATDGNKPFGSYDKQPVTWTTNNDGGAVSFVGSGRHGVTGTFPIETDSGPPNAYAAGSFLYSSPVWILTSPSSGTYSVTIDNSGYDLKEGNDFGAAHPSVISGTLTGHALDAGGHLKPGAQPLAGWTVQLLDENKKVVATTTSGSDGVYLFGLVKPGQYQIRQVVPAGWKQLSPFNSDLQFVQQPASTVPAYQGSASSIAAADFNGDGHVDFAVAATDLSQLQVFDNTGSGTFTGPRDYPIDTLSGLSQVTAGYFSGSGRPDLAVTDTGNNVHQLNNVGGNFEELAFPQQPSLGTLVDIARLPIPGADAILVSYWPSSSSAGVYLFSGGGEDQQDYPLPRSGQSFIQAGYLAAGDLNKDGTADLVDSGGGVDNMVTPTHAFFNVALGNNQDGGLKNWVSYALPAFPGAGGLVGANGFPVALGDITGDGSLDAVGIALQTFDAPTRFGFDIAFNRGDGVFQNIVPYETDPGMSYPTQVFLKDLNGDGRPDLVFLMGNQWGKTGPGLGGFVVYLNTGIAPYFDMAHPLVFPFPGNAQPTAMAIADVNNDGLPDLIVLDKNPGVAAKVFLNTTPQNGLDIPITVVSGQTLLGNDFVDAQTARKGAIEGTVYDDLNRNGSKDTGESGGAGHIVYVDLQHTGRYAPGDPFAVTIATGAYSIPGLAEGDYSVGVVPEDGWSISTPGGNFVQVTVGPDGVSHADFGRSPDLIQPIADQQATQGQPFSLSVALTGAGAAEGQLRFSLEGDVPAGARINPTTGLFTWTPSAGPGQTRVTIRVRDPFQTLQTDTATFLITVSGGTPTQDPTVAFVTALYRHVLDRDPDAPGMAGWVAFFQAGGTRQQVAEALWDSPEHRGLQVDQFYATYLHRAADPAGRASWVERLMAGASEAEVARGFLTSPEYSRSHPGALDYLLGLYADVLGRAPDADGMEAWLRAP
jgi:hypothetical protein